MIRKGQPWERAVGGPPDVEVTGGDAELAAAVTTHPGARIAFSPRESDLARSVGLVGPGRDVELALDGLRWPGGIAVNALVWGTAPDHLRWWTRAIRVQVDAGERTLFEGRATGVVIASGQFVHGFDVVPRGHPGDGRLEVQVYALPRFERRRLRARLASGTHVPHPDLPAAAGTRVQLLGERRLPLEVDGRSAGTTDRLTVEVVPDACRLLA